MVIPSPRPTKKARIEIIPLIDIIFFLLATFVMVSLSMIKNRALPVTLPAASSASIAQPDDWIALTLTADDGLFLNKEPVDLRELPDRLRQLKQAQTEPRILIHGDIQAHFGAAIAVLDLVRQAGIDRVSIATQPPPAEPLPLQP